MEYYLRMNNFIENDKLKQPYDSRSYTKLASSNTQLSARPEREQTVYFRLAQRIDSLGNPLKCDIYTHQYPVAEMIHNSLPVTHLDFDL